MHKILVVDNNDSLFKMIHMEILRFTEKMVILAKNGLDIKKTGDLMPDLVVLNSGLPNPDWRDAVRELKRIHPGETPMVLVGDGVTDSLRHDARAMGVDAITGHKKMAQAITSILLNHRAPPHTGRPGEYETENNQRRLIC